MSRGASKSPRVDCPVCGRQAAVTRSTEQIRRHLGDMWVGGLRQECAGSGRRVDLWGSGPAREVEP